MFSRYLNDFCDIPVFVLFAFKRSQDFDLLFTYLQSRIKKRLAKSILMTLSPDQLFVQNPILFELFVTLRRFPRRYYNKHIKSMIAQMNLFDPGTNV